MKIFIPTPSFALHGGIRIILEWANRLSEYHEVTLFSLANDSCNWFDILPSVNITTNDCLDNYDCLLITSPHTIHYQDRPDAPKKIFIFMQMMESMFRPADLAWQEKCRQWYLSPHPLIAISKWNIEMLQAMNRTGATYYIGNGVNTLHFPIDTTPKDFKTVLFEGWGAANPSKDTERIGERVAGRLRQKGYRILAYSANPKNVVNRNIAHEYYQQPTLEKMNELYSRATILVKATQFDARSTAPIEAMTKGTVTARAITLGDDDLQHYSNCLRGPYQEEALYQHALQLLTDKALHQSLSEQCIRHINIYSWAYWMNRINKIITQ